MPKALIKKGSVVAMGRGTLELLLTSTEGLASTPLSYYDDVRNVRTLWGLREVFTPLP